jgi:hypothetical protein
LYARTKMRRVGEKPLPSLLKNTFNNSIAQ